MINIQQNGSLSIMSMYSVGQYCCSSLMDLRCQCGIHCSIKDIGSNLSNYVFSVLCFFIVCQMVVHGGLPSIHWSQLCAHGTNREVDWSHVRHFGAYGRLFLRENRTCLFDIPRSFGVPLVRFFVYMVYMDYKTDLKQCSISITAPWSCIQGFHTGTLILEKCEIYWGRM